MSHSHKIQVRLLLNLAVLVAVLFSFSIPWPASADSIPGTNPGGEPLVDVKGSIDPIVTEVGKISWSIDGLGTNNPAGGTIQVEKPSGATVRKAYFAAASTGFRNRVLNNGDVGIDGVGVNWDVTVPSSIRSYNSWADVTNLVKPKIDAAPPGRIDFAINENGTTGIDGEILTVIFDDPSQTADNTVLLLFGAQDVLGDTFAIRLANSINAIDPNLRLDLSLGISYGFQPDGQFSIIDVNGIRLTSSAGGQDDGQGANGALLTVGGLDDSISNPPDPSVNDAGGARVDDELYDLRPFVSSGNIAIDVHTINPSVDDNIFFGGVFLRGATAAVGESIVLAPSMIILPVGIPHLLLATVQNNLGNPIIGRDVTFSIASGPNAGRVGTAQTDANGNAVFNYVSNTSGTDTIVASFTNSQGQTVTSNTASVTFALTKQRFTQEQKDAAAKAEDDFQKQAVAEGLLAVACASLPELVITKICALSAGLLAPFTGFLAYLVGKIAEDPADSNFTVIALPITPTLPQQPIVAGGEITQQLADASNALLANQGQAIGLAGAILTALNRAQGAYEAGDTSWEEKQMVAAQQYAAQLAVLFNAQPQLLTNLQSALRAAGFQHVTTVNDVASFQASVSQNGLPSWLVQSLLQLGANTETLDAIRIDILTQDANAVAALGNGDFVQALTDPTLLTSLQQAAQALNEFSAPEVQNQVPTAGPNGPYAANEGDEIIFDGTASSDPDGDALSYSWNFGDGSTGSGPTPTHTYADDGDYIVTLTVTDPGGLSDTKTTTASIANALPRVEAGPDQTVFRNDLVALTGTWTDPAGALDEPYSWTWDLTGDSNQDSSGTAAYGNAIPASAKFALEGKYTLTFQVTDKDGGAGSDSLIVEVLNRPPDCSGATPSLDTIWPPDHKFVPIEVLGVTDPEGDPITINIDRIFQDELVDTTGDGSFTPDGQGVSTATAEVRAERVGTKKAPGNGRVYHIGFTANDGHGGTCSGEVLVGVPHDVKDSPVDDGPLYDSTVP